MSLDERIDELGLREDSQRNAERLLRSARRRGHRHGVKQILKARAEETGHAHHEHNLVLDNAGKPIKKQVKRRPEARVNQKLKILQL